MLERYAAVLLLAAISLPGMAADLPNHPFIHVSATADNDMMPDVGEIDIDIVSLGPDADAAWKLVNERLEGSRALFAQHGIAVEEVLPEGQPVPMETRVSLHADVIYRIGGK